MCVDRERDVYEMVIQGKVLEKFFPDRELLRLPVEFDRANVKASNAMGINGLGSLSNVAALKLRKFVYGSKFRLLKCGM